MAASHQSCDVGSNASRRPSPRKLKLSTAREMIRPGNAVDSFIPTTEEGWKATIIAGKAIALTAYDLLTHPERVKVIQDQFKAMKAKEGK